MKKYIFLFIMILAFVNCQNENENITEIILKLEEKIYTYQVRHQQEYQSPFKQAKKLGLFKNEIRYNFVGNPVSTFLRNSKLTGIFDNNMFATGCILATMFDARLYGSGMSGPTNSSLKLVLNAINDFKDKNSNKPNTTTIRTFWQQVYNVSKNIWEQHPDNLNKIMPMVYDLPWERIISSLKSIHLNELATAFNQSRKFSLINLDDTKIAADFDDAYLNIQIGARLQKLNESYSELYQEWLINNSNVSELLNATIKYAYRPLDSKNSEASIINPRTYFCIRDFINGAKNANESLALITTWSQNIAEQRERQKKSVSMPFNVNDIDATVCANSLYGLAAAALSDLNGFQRLFVNSSEIQQIFLNTTRFVSWVIKTNFTDRPDLVLVYYPSTFNFLWYTSRILFLLENEFRASKVPHELQNVFKHAKEYLEKALEGNATEFFFSRVKKEANSKYYFEDFLGVNDTSFFGLKKPTGEDRIFSTALAVNTLFYTWTYHDSLSKKLLWKENVPVKVKNTIFSCINWLKENVLSVKYKSMNAFFSTSVKGFSSIPFWYPVNYLQFLNGTDADPSKLAEKDFRDVIFGVQGVVDEHRYMEMLVQPRYGQKTPIYFQGYNEKTSFFAFWSSEPYTHSVSLLAFSLYNNLFTL